MTEETADCGGNQKIQHQGSGTIPALADDEDLMGGDDDYDDLYSDVNVGESFFQAHHQPQIQAQVGVTGNGSLQAQKVNVAEPKMAAGDPSGSVEQKYQNGVGQIGVNGAETRSGVYQQTSNGLNHDVQANKTVPVGTTSVVLNSHGFPGYPVSVAEPVHNSYGAVSQQIPVNVNTNVNHAMMNKIPVQPIVDNGNTMLFVGELQWWTTDAEIESVLSQYGSVKEIKFFDERVSGKSKGYCQVEFYDSIAAATCKQGMNGYIFNGKPCVVAFASPETLKQMGANFTGRNQGQNQVQNRKPLNDGMGRDNNNMNIQSGDGGRNYGRGGFARGAQGMGNRGGPWGRGLNNMGGNVTGQFGSGLAGQAFGGPATGMMHPQGIMGAGFDPTFMGHGGGYGGYPGLAFPGIPPSYPGVNGMGMVGVAPHVNPAFFGRGMGATNGYGMMGTTGMDGVHGAMWNEANGAGGSEYVYEDENQEKDKPNGSTSQDKEQQITKRDWSEKSVDKKHHEERREHKYHEEKDSYRDHRHKDRDSSMDRGYSSSKSRSRSRMAEDDHRSRSRDTDYGKRRRAD